MTVGYNAGWRVESRPRFEAENIAPPDIKTFVFDPDSRKSLLDLDATRPQAIPKGMAPLVEAAKDQKLALDLTPSIKE